MAPEQYTMIATVIFTTPNDEDSLCEISDLDIYDFQNEQKDLIVKHITNVNKSFQIQNIIDVRYEDTSKDKTQSLSKVRTNRKRKYFIDKVYIRFQSEVLTPYQVDRITDQNSHGAFLMENFAYNVQCGYFYLYIEGLSTKWY